MLQVPLATTLPGLVDGRVAGHLGATNGLKTSSIQSTLWNITTPLLADPPPPVLDPPPC